MSKNRIKREIVHARTIIERGEQVWNWSSPAGRIRWERRCHLFTSFLEGSKSDVLEIGCGTGLFTECLSQTIHQIKAIDISEELLNIARNRIPHSDVVFQVDNAYKSNFNDAKFDYIVGSSVLHHLEVKQALIEMSRLLKPGGRLMFTEPNMLNPQIFLQKNIPILKKWAGDSPDETAFFRWEIRKSLKRCGFINIRVRPFDFLHPAIPRFLLSFITPVSYWLESIPLIKEIAGSLIITAEKPINNTGK